MANYDIAMAVSYRKRWLRQPQAAVEAQKVADTHRASITQRSSVLSVLSNEEERESAD
jgi:hypothetical protein